MGNPATTSAETAIINTLAIVPLADVQDVLRLHPQCAASDIRVALSRLIATGKVIRDADEHALFRRMR